MCNNAWSDLFPSCRNQYLKYEGSDHRSLLAFLDTTVIKGKGIFRFDGRLKENQEVKNLVKKIWKTLLTWGFRTSLPCAAKQSASGAKNSIKIAGKL